MANYRTIAPSFWTDSKVDDHFTPEDKYFYLYLLTNPHTNICGCYEIGNKQFERETGYNSDTISRLIDRMQNLHDVIRYDNKTKEILILNWYKYNWSKSEKLLTAVRKVSDYIKNETFKDYILGLIENDFSYEYPQSTEYRIQSTDNRIQSTDNRLQITDVSIGYTYGIDTLSIPYKNTEKKKKQNKKEPFFQNEELNNAFLDFIEMRKNMKAPLNTQRAINLNINKLNKLSGGDEQKALEIINQTIERGWKSFFELKTDSKVKSAANNKFNNFTQRDNDFNSMEKMLLGG